MTIHGKMSFMWQYGYVYECPLCHAWFDSLSPPNHCPVCKYVKIVSSIEKIIDRRSN